jgi:hypothetical protein
MLILDKARALNLILWNSERICVPEQFLTAAGDAAARPPLLVVRPQMPATLVPAERSA